MAKTTPPEKSSFKSGFVAVIGRPNVGKSTLLNTLVNAKVSITSPKPQTTRRRILGVKTTKETQIIFVDTPGAANTNDLLGKEMRRHITDSTKDADLVLFMADARYPPSNEEKKVLTSINPSSPVILLLNKIDLVKDKHKILPCIELYTSLWPFADTFPISAIDGENIPELLKAIEKFLPEGPLYFDPEDLTEQSPEFHAAEIIREKVLRFVHQEVPHAVAVSVDEMRPGRTQETKYIRATIFVEKNSQKGILVGKNGQMLKKIGASARVEIERWVKQKVFLELWVKVKEDWKDREELLRLFGYTSE